MFELQLGGGLPGSQWDLVPAHAEILLDQWKSKRKVLRVLPDVWEWNILSQLLARVRNCWRWYLWKQMFENPFSYLGNRSIIPLPNHSYFIGHILLFQVLQTIGKSRCFLRWRDARNPVQTRNPLQSVLINQKLKLIVYQHLCLYFDSIKSVLPDRSGLRYFLLDWIFDYFWTI